MRRLSAVLFAAVLTAVFLCPLRATADDPPTRSQQWRALAVQALARFRADDDGAQRTNTYAWAAEAELRLNGDTPYLRQLLNKIYSQRKPDGGWGLNFAHDKFDNGTINDINTTYTVTLAGHVGPPFLLAYQRGIDVITAPDGSTWSIKAQLKVIVNLLMTTPRIDTAQGQCLAYSRNPNDNVPYGCVHNASAGAARFLFDVNAAGIGKSGLAALVEGITRREAYAYVVSGLSCGGQPRTNWYRYMDTPSCNDADHNSYNAESMYFLAPPIGQNMAWMHMTNSFSDNTNAPVAHFRLAALPPIPGRIDAATGLATWCILGDQWLTESQQFLASSTDLQRVTQVAQGAARVADNCRPPGEPVPQPSTPPGPDPSASTAPSGL
jgi:hypothetical protein